MGGLVTTAALSAEIRYTLVDLGPTTQAHRLNSSGEVVGTTVVTGHIVRGFFYSKGQVSAITRPDGANIFPTGLNDDGVVVGEARAPRAPGIPKVFAAEPFIYSAGKLSPYSPASLDPPLKLRSVFDISNTGSVLAETDERPSRLILISADKLLSVKLPLGLIPPDMHAVYETKRAGRDSGVLITVHGIKFGKGGDPGASAVDIDGPSHALLIVDGSTTDLGDFRAEAVNRNGVVVGTLVASPQVFHACLKDKIGLRDLGTPPGFESSHALDINATGQIVGTSNTILPGGGFLRIDMNSDAFLYENGRWEDLNELADLRKSGIEHLTRAEAINDRGQILCAAMGSGTIRAVLLTPIGVTADPSGK